jgi:ribosomal protein S18 acetylase RimI-like enzyme
MDCQIREMTLADYDAAFKLWNETEHMSLNECDSRDGIALYLRRNPGLCFVAYQGSLLIGTVLCGHDGRRGLLRHLTVTQAHRGSGIATALIEKALENLALEGIGQCNIFVMDANLQGLSFWKKMGWLKMADTYRTFHRRIQENEG